MMLSKTNLPNGQRNIMTIQPKRNSFTVHCDTCPNYFDVEDLMFKYVVQEIRIKNWKTYQDKSGKWSHKCPACQEG